MGDFSLSDAGEWTGEWWLPDDPDDKKPGVLTYSPEDGLLLRLIGGWDYKVTRPGDDGATIVTSETKRWPVVLGVGDGKFLTILNAGVANARAFTMEGFFGAPDKLDLHAETALVGIHLSDPDEAAFIIGSAAVENMTVWSRRTGIEERIYFGSKPDEVSGEIRLSRLSPITTKAGDLKVSLDHWAWQPYSERTRAGVQSRVRENTRIRFKKEQAEPLAYWLDLLDGVADLLSLSTLRPCALIAVKVFYPPTPGNYREDHPLRDQPHEIEVYRRRVVLPYPNRPALNFHDFVLTLDDVPFETLLPRWLEVRERFAAARSMILGLRYVRNGYVETRVVTAVAAAEAMHRALDPVPPIPPDEFKQLRRDLLAAVPATRRDWLADRLTEHSNVPTLRSRLLDLVDRTGGAGDALVADRDAWSKAARDSRNSLSHVGADGGADLERLHVVAESTAAVVVLNLLLELGVSKDRLRTLAGEHQELIHTSMLARRVICDDDSMVIRMGIIGARVVDDTPSCADDPADRSVHDDSVPIE